ncbi:MAG: hypothetical protein CBC11_004230 [Proteobacteria bacterium TMED51]|nr:MAG: hypothetical protein CBC11_004230 [Proteobacteria bacterium TMED51]
MSKIQETRKPRISYGRLLLSRGALVKIVASWLGWVTVTRQAGLRGVCRGHRTDLNPKKLLE